MYTVATDIHIGQPARDTYYVEGCSIDIEKASFDDKGTNEVTQTRADRMVMGCKVGYLKCQAPDVRFFLHPMGVVTEHTDKNEVVIDEHYDFAVEQDYSDSEDDVGKRAGKKVRDCEFVKNDNGYAYVAFVNGNVELFESARVRKTRVRKRAKTS